MISIPEIQPSESSFNLLQEVEKMFSPHGLLAKAKNFEYRPQQQQMAVAVAQALQDGQHLVVEAGTGVGKSLAYLIPAIFYAVEKSKKAIVSTHTINLQEQLIDKDLPMLGRILPVPFKYTMLKGRQNYLCTRRLSRAIHQAESLFTSPEQQELLRIHEWAKETPDGSLSDFKIEPDAKVWQQVCSERGLCSPKLCGPQSDFAKDHIPCFYQRARSRFMSADVLVMNHTLFFMHLGGLEEPVKNGILLRNDFVIFDEAHTVENVASKHIGLNVSNAQIRYTLQRLWNPKTEKGLLAMLRQGKAVEHVANLLKSSELFFNNVEETCDQLAHKSRNFAGQSDDEGPTKGRSWSELRIRRPDLVSDTLSLPLQRVRESISDITQQVDDKEIAEELAECNRRLSELREELAGFLSQTDEEHVYWVERSGKGRNLIVLNSAPICVADFLRSRLFGSNTSVIMTSATLATQGTPVDQPSEKTPASPSVRHKKKAENGMRYVASRIGADQARLLQVGSPFDYQQQMKVYVVGKMPDPREEGYEDALVHWIQHFVELTHGKAFVLFTNSKLMRKISERMEPFFRELDIECMVQGTGTPRSLMLELFKENIDSVLFGTDSFWQGVDVPGEALSNVIITRLPFSVPDHPLIEARVEYIESHGGNPFSEFSLPEAILKFRQGVGRLIRLKTDKGIVVVLDNRILTKRYGQAFLDAIPQCPVAVV